MSNKERGNVVSIKGGPYRTSDVETPEIHPYPEQVNACPYCGLKSRATGDGRLIGPLAPVRCTQKDCERPYTHMIQSCGHCNRAWYVRPHNTTITGIKSAWTCKQLEELRQANSKREKFDWGDFFYKAIMLFVIVNMIAWAFYKIWW